MLGRMVAPPVSPDSGPCSSRRRLLPMQVRAEDWEVPVHCARCSKAGLIEIRMRVADRDLTFRRCGRCEAQTWETTDGPVPLVHVLELARTR